MADTLREITTCEVCGGSNLRVVLDLGLHPMCDDLVRVDDDRECERYPIQILFCSECITAHQRFQIPKQNLFPRTYHYRSRHTADVLEGMSQLVETCLAELGTVSDKMILDIGCNDGSLLTAFRNRGATRTFGIEPTDAAIDARAQGHHVCQNFLTETVARKFVEANGRPDIITFTNVFAHIEDLQEVVRSLLELAHAETTIVIENHYLGAVLDRKQFDTFYHEHPRTYSYTSLMHIAAALQRVIAVAQFPQRYGGNIRVLLRASKSTEGSEAANTPEERERHFEARLLLLADEIEVWKTNKRAELRAAFQKHGRLPAKAFPGRSAIPVALLGIDENLISAVYEKPASGKIGYFVPGTRIPIRSDDDYDATSADGPVVNMAWHIGEEIRGYMRQRGYRGELIDIISPSDFDRG